MLLRFLALAFLVAGLSPAQSANRNFDIPVLVPVTGFLALEGTAQRNGALLALATPLAGIITTPRVADTSTSPEVAVNALQRALRGTPPVAIGASIFGTQMLAMLPIAARAGVPLLTISGTAKLTELGNPYIFRFFPGDRVVKTAQARYAVEVLGAKRPALLYQTTAYGQSGRAELKKRLAALGAPLVFEEALSPKVKDMAPALTRVAAARPDVILLHLHSGPSALVVRQAKALGLTQKIIGGSALHQPTTAALLAPGELANVCAESASSPISENTPAFRAFTAEYRARFKSAPDAFALGQYDAMKMMIAALEAGADTPAKMQTWLASNRYTGLAMTYRSDGKGNMAHDAVIICYDGTGRVPAVVKRYRDVDGHD
ncbi:MAG: ABC transporter substrate-binding protein [Pseudomonadota bacterium]|nr:ABC transporter substrate-binding protein [Pseudomonadota bacterium]MEC9175311.1 ABC transporter substrate-binding protein [Pseudomonadota bacterium]